MSVNKISRRFSSSQSFKLVICGGGTGGITMAHKLASKVGSDIAIIEPKDKHFYQPYFTLVGAGIKKYENSYRDIGKYIPSGVAHISDEISSIVPDKNHILLKSDKRINYDILIIALGCQTNYHQVEGLIEALQDHKNVCSNYSPLYVRKTSHCIENFKGGKALFTHPNTSIKCGGASQKIMYLAEDIWRRNNKRDLADIHFVTAGNAIFGVPRYTEVLQKIASERGINVTPKHNLKRVIGDKNIAVFDKTGDEPKEVEMEYSLLHVTPPMSAPNVIRENEQLCDASGYLNVNTETLQHAKYQNIFGIGDCLNILPSKTAAAIAGQCGILRRNVNSYLKGKELVAKYDGYTSCPLVTGKNKGILAEFDKNGVPLETFPFPSQIKEKWYWYHLKATSMPPLYWNFLLKGYWEGPSIVRKLLRLGF